MVQLFEDQDTILLPSLLNTRFLLHQQTKRKPRRKQKDHAELVEKVVTWLPTFLLPIELARIALAAKVLRPIVAETCAHLLRKSSCFLPPDASRLWCGEQVLHRMQRFQAAATSVCVAAENYSVAVSGGCLVIWGRPGWLEPAPQVAGMRIQFDEWPPLLPTIAVAASKLDGKNLVIASLAASRHAVFALTDAGEMLFTQVRRSKYGGIQSIELQPLVELQGVRVVQIGTRFGQAFAISESGSVYAWGMKSGDTNQPLHRCSMGFGCIATVVHPEKLPCFLGSATPIRSVASGVSHTIFVSIYGEVYTVGRNEASKLGLGCSVEEQEQVLTPRKVRFPSRPTPSIIAAAAGAKHSLFLSSNGRVWGCGHRGHGQLPTTHLLPSFTVASTPRPLDLVTAFCTSVAAGIGCSFFVGECGEVYYTGQARQTKCPFKRPTDRSDIPWKIDGLTDVIHVSVSMEMSSYRWEHAIFAHQDGSFSGWGHNGHGELPIETGRLGSVPGFANSVVQFSL